MQGAYRIWGAHHELVESFVAAPGPAGWRYFGRARDARTGEELFKVDYIVEVQVLGLPPRGEEKGFISHDLVRAGMQRTVEPDGPLVLGVDVARYGSDATAIYARRGYAPVYHARRRGVSVTETAAWVADRARELAEPGEHVSIFTDDGGVGGGVTDLLLGMRREKLLDATIEGMNFGGKGDRNYASSGGVWWGRIRRLLAEGTLALPGDEALAEELTNRTFEVNMAGKMVLEPKDHMRSRGAPSPDMADALALAYAGVTDGEWEQVYGIVRCQECGHGYVNPEGTRPCPKCGITP